MAVSLRRTSEEQAPGKKPDITEIVVRMLIGVLVNYLSRKLKDHFAEGKERKKAQRGVAKLAKKGKEVPEELKKEAVSGLSRHQKKKLAKKGKKKAAKAKKKGKKGRKLLMLLIIGGVAVALAMRASKKQ